MSHKGHTTFMGYNEGEIAYMVRKGLEENSLYYSTNLEGEITGMILAEVDHKKKVVFVIENLSMNMRNLITFAQKARTQFHGYAIEAMRHITKHRKYNTTKLYKKLCQVEYPDQVVVQHHN